MLLFLIPKTSTTNMYRKKLLLVAGWGHTQTCRDMWRYSCLIILEGWLCSNAGFDPDKFRVDFYGNVLYWNADPSSPLAWEVDHWFPHARMSQQNPNSKQNPGRKKPFMFWCVYMYPLTSGPTRQILLCLTARNRTLPNDQTPRIDGFGSVQRPSRRRI